MEHDFEVDIKHDEGTTLSFSCSRNQSIIDDDDDAFTIDKVTLGNTSNTYAVSGDILDGYLYDLLMTMLDERGIDNQFVHDLSDYCSAYEHLLYINLLQKLQTFAATE